MIRVTYTRRDGELEVKPRTRDFLNAKDMVAWVKDEDVIVLQTEYTGTNMLEQVYGKQYK